MEHYLVTGGSGFLGRHLLTGLREAGYELTGLGRREWGSFRWIRADLTRPETLRLGPDSYQTVVHAAGHAHAVPRTRDDEERFFTVNARGTQHLLEALDRLPQAPEHFVLISTVAVYGRASGELLDESTPAEASDPYGVSKIEAERLVREWAGGRGVRCSVLRLPLVYGEDPPGNLGALSSAIRRRRYAGIHPGTARRSIVWARDVAGIVPRVTQTAGTYHLTDGEHPTFRQLEMAYAARHGVPSPPSLPWAAARLLAWAGDPLTALVGERVPLNSRRFEKMTCTLTFSDDLARARLGWNPARVLPLIHVS